MDKRSEQIPHQRRYMKGVSTSYVIWELKIIVTMRCYYIHELEWASLVAQKESACKAGDPGSIPGLGRRGWLPIPVLFLGEFHGQRILVGYSPLSHKKTQLSN